MLKARSFTLSSRASSPNSSPPGYSRNSLSHRFPNLRWSEYAASAATYDEIEPEDIQVLREFVETRHSILPMNMESLHDITEDGKRDRKREQVNRMHRDLKPSGRDFIKSVAHEGGLTGFQWTPAPEARFALVTSFST